MKKLTTLLALFFISFNGISQTCEEREQKLLEGIGSFSAGMLYNTYAVIGAIADGYMADAYDAAQLNDILDSQKRMADNLVGVFEDLNKNALRAQSDKEYATSAIRVLKGLKRQAQLFQDYVSTKNKKKQEEFEVQRKTNWKDISKLMGIDEED